MTDDTGEVITDEDKKFLFQMFPHLEALEEGSIFHGYREFKPRKDVVEFTVFAREPSGARWRIDAEVESRTLRQLESIENIEPKHLKIIDWVNQNREEVL